MKKMPMQVYLDEQDRELLDRLAKREGLSLAETLRSAIRRWAMEANAEGDPVLNLIGSIDDPAAPADLSTRHDEYAVQRSPHTSPPKPAPSGRRPK
jgi:hypothetical protein